MRDVARVAGVSLSTVSLVVAGQPGVGEETRVRILDAIQRLGYNLPLRPKQDQLRYTLAIISERLVEPIERDIFYAEILQGIQMEAQAQGHRVLLHLLQPGDSATPLLDASLQEDIDGMVLANGGDLTDVLITRLANSRVPAVLVDNYVISQPLHCVVADNVTAGYLATQHLLRLGHRRVALLPGPRKYRSLVDRQVGYLDALAEYGLPIDQDLMPPSTHHAGGQKGYHQMLRLLELPQPPTGVVTISDKTAFGAMEALKESGKQIPGDMALVSIDDVAESAHTTPALTSVHVPRAEMGAEAIRRLLALLSGYAPRPTKTVLYTNLVVRESCGAKNALP
jgi:DNA-binding LacI/PurR family transcriptional regulator